MTIIADENIPGVVERFSHLGPVRTIEGRTIRAEHLRSAEVLLVRSVTQVDASLLRDTPVRFVGSATIGVDHVDTEYLRGNGIAFAFAPGSNARSVADYVVAALLATVRESGMSMNAAIMGIVGYGNIGSRVAKRVRGLGMEVVVNDPPLEYAGNAPAFEHMVSLDELLSTSSVVSLHVPLTRVGPYPTWHLLDDVRLGLLREGCILVNTSRGGVLSTEALLRTLQHRGDLRLVLDVWEREPHPSLTLVQRATLATPHIAGYSYDGKLTGTAMLHEALTQFLGIRMGAEPAGVGTYLPLEPSPSRDPVAWADDLVRQMYDVRADDRRMRMLLDVPEDEVGDLFTRQRKTYPDRREFWNYRLSRIDVPDRFVQMATQGLGIELSEPKGLTELV